MRSHIDIARDILLKSKQKKAEDEQSSSAEIKTSAKLRSPDDIARDIWLQHNQINANPVSKWVNKFNQTMNGISDYTTKLNGGYTTDASGGFSNAVAELLQEYEGIKDTAANYGFTDAAKYVKQLQDLQGNIKSANEWYAAFTPTEEQAAAGYTAEDIFAEWSKDNTFRQKYQGKSYEEIQRAIYITPKDSEEHKWLTAYAPTIMTAADYDTEIKNSDAQIVNLEAVLKEYDRLVKQVSTADPDSYANVRLAEIRKQYGSKADIEGQLSAAKASKGQLENDQKYKLLSGNDDFDEQSKATSTEQTSNYIDYVLKNDKWKYDIINGLISSSAKSNYENGNPIMGGIWSELEGNVSYMMDEEKKIFNYLYNTQGANSAEKYLDSLENTLSERAGKYTQDEWRKLAHKHPVSSSVVSVATNLYGGLGYIDAAVQKAVNSAKEAITGEYAGPVNYNSVAMMPSKVTTAIRGQVAQDLVDEHGVIEMKEEEHPVLSKILNGKSWADVYQLGMSMVDSAAVAGLSTVVGPNATLLLSGSAATQTMLDAVANGATDGQALAMGAAAGAFEYIFEKYELEHLLGADTNVVKAIFNQGLTEAIGESATSIANFAADTFIMAEKSDWQKSVQQYMRDNPGMTEAEARKQALIDTAIQIGWDAVGGLLSGGFMGGGSSLIKNVSGKLQQAKTDAQGLQTPHQSPTATAGSGGMPATGRHGDFDSLRDAPPQGEAFKGADSSAALGMTAEGGAQNINGVSASSLAQNDAQKVLGDAVAADRVLGENGQGAQETAAEAKPASLEWVNEIAALDAEKLGVTTPQSAQGAASSPDKGSLGAQGVFENFEDILARGTNAPADPIGAALDSFKQTGTVTNKQATDILNNSKALQSLREQVGLELPETAAGRRNAIKAAVEQLAQVQAVVNAEAQGEDVESRRLTESDIDDYMSVGDRKHVRDTKQRLMDNGESPVLTKPEEIVNFIRNAFQRKIQKVIKGYGRVNNRLSNAVKSATNGSVVIDDYYLELDADKIAHISDHVGQDKDIRNIPLTEAQLEKLPEYIDTYDDLIEIIRRKDGSVRLMLGKKINGHSIIVETVSKGRKSLHPVTAYQIDSADYMKHYKTRAIDRSSTSRSANTDTVDISRPTIALDNSISETEPGVNTILESTAEGAEDTTASVGAAPAGFDQNTAKTDIGKSKQAAVLTETPKTEKAKRSLWSFVKEGVFDKGMVFEDLSLKTKNRELQAKWNSTRYAQSRAQWLIGNGTDNTKSLNAIRGEVEKTGKTKEFAEYLYHKHNIDRMQLQSRYDGAKNKPVFGDTVTAEASQGYVEQYEKENPSFVQLAEDVYAYMNHLRQLMVDNGVISQEAADLWAKMYPHYVPIQRAEKDGRGVDVPLDTGRTGVSAPVKKAKGGSGDILPLFDTMAQRTLQTYTAIARNNFGVELKNTLGTVVSKNIPKVDEVIDSVDTQDDLLQDGKNGTNPTFTVFENGERVTFEITKEMYDALKPKSEVMSYTNKVTNAISNFHRGVLTEYNPTFMLTNAIKDVQDVLINSQHPAKTYAKIPQAYVELAKKGKWYTEYVANGGDQNTYFDSETSTFETEDAGLKKLLDAPPLGTISKLNSFIEMAPRLAEYIASREAGRSIDVSMLDAARVTTNFAAGGDLTKWLDRNGATFLNASMQGVVQQARNFREAKANGWKGAVGLAIRFALAGLPEALLNGFIWDDDEDYAELSDYVKDNYYILWKYDNGQFVKIPKGRVVAVIQGAVRRIIDTATGNDEADWGRLLELVGSSLAPNNPFESNIFSPIQQVLNNKTWYGEDLVPSRLQDLPAAEQYDESTDALSKWLGEKLNVSPVKINYLLNQYGGGIADTFLPMLTPEAESGDDSLVGNLLAPLKDKFTTDSVMSNQNVSDFYDKLDELTTNAKASGATVEDKILYKYMNSINSKLRDLYTEKRQVQSGDLPDDQKYAQVRSIQQEITEAAKQALKACRNPYSADKSGMVAGVIGDSLSGLTDSWKSGTDTAGAVAAIDKAYEAYTKMDDDGKEGVKAEGGRAEDYLIARESEISHKTFVDLYKTYYNIDKGSGNASEKASHWSYELEKAQEKGAITTAQKNVLKENMNFWQMIPAETERFDELTNNGLSADKADYVTEVLSWIKPEVSGGQVRPIQKIEAIANADDKLTEAEQKTAIKSVLSDSTYDKFMEVLSLGMSVDRYATSYRLYLDAEGGKGKKERTIAQYQKELGISYSTAKDLYEIYCPPAK